MHKKMKVLAMTNASTFNCLRKCFQLPTQVLSFLGVSGLNSHDLFYSLHSTQLFDESFGA